MKYLYKYPQTEYPYGRLLAESLNRNREVAEFELMDTDCFDDNRYWDIAIEFAKDGENETETLIRVWATNRGPEPASLHIIPQTLFRNTWSWGGPHSEESLKPRMKLDSRGSILRAKHFAFPRRRYTQFTSSPSPTNPEDEVHPTVVLILVNAYYRCSSPKMRPISQSFGEDKTKLLTSKMPSTIALSEVVLMR